MREIPQHILDFVKGHEGVRLAPYPDPVGIWTIGVGATRGLDGKPVTKEHPVLTMEQVDMLLRRDIKTAQRSVERLIAVPLSDNAYGALVSFAFNLGGGALQVSTLRKVINRGDLDCVQKEFEKWVWAGRPKRRLPGLIRRRHEEALLFFTPDLASVAEPASPSPSPELVQESPTSSDPRESWWRPRWRRR